MFDLDNAFDIKNCVSGSRSARGGQTGSPGSFQGGGPSGGAISPKPNKGKNPFADEDESEAEWLRGVHD